MNDRDGYLGPRPQTWLMTAGQLAPASALATRLNAEVNNSLASILAGLQSLGKEGELSPDDEYVVSLLVAETRSLNRTVHTLLESVRIDAGVFQPVTVESLLNGCTATLDEQVCGGGVDVRITGVSPSPRLVVDQRAMERALSHLVRNAIEASQTGGEVRLGWSFVERERRERLFPGFEGEVVSIYGDDSGPGLPSCFPVESLFEPLVTTTSSKIGMGLSVARCLVELHGGVLLVHSLLAGGTRFEVLMPVADIPTCWDVAARETCTLPPCNLQCEVCEAKVEQPQAPCWVLRGKSHRERDGTWPRACASCTLFRAHHLSLFLAFKKPGKDENHGGDCPDCR